MLSFISFPPCSWWNRVFFSTYWLCKYRFARKGVPDQRLQNEGLLHLYASNQLDQHMKYESFLVHSYSIMIPHRDSPPPDVQQAHEYRIWENEFHLERPVHHLLICENLQTASPTCLGTIGTPIRVMGEKEEGCLGTESHSKHCWLDGKGYKDLNGWNHVLHRGIQRIGLWRGSAVKAFKGAK